MADDAWGDLFAKAGDVGSSSNIHHDPVMAASTSTSRSGRPNSQDDNGRGKLSNESSSDGRKQQNKKRKRKRNQKPSGESSSSSSSSSNMALFDEMLKSRMMIRPTSHNNSDTDNSSAWPPWLHLTGPILQTRDDKKCHAWKAVEDSESSSSSSSNFPSICLNCGTSALNHRAAVSEDETIRSWPFLSFVELRNLRCVGSSMARKYQSTRVSSSFIECVLQQGSDTSLVSIGSIIKSVSRGSNEMSSMKPLIWRELPEDEARILESKLNDVIRYCTVLANSMPVVQSSKKWKKKERPESSSSTVSQSHWEPAVRLIIACDALYYRLYYLQLIRLLPATQSSSGAQCFLPHPSEYFGWPCLTLDDSTLLGSQFRSHVASLTSADDDSKDGKKPPLSGANSWLNEFTALSEKESSRENAHPLVDIHRLRQIETMALFQESGWMESPKTEEKTLKSLEKFTDKDSMHETPAPDVLMQWRDGCRDFLCNLYAYATLSSVVVGDVSSFLLDANLGVVEIGAGTGYIAKLLQDRGVTVDAWDVHPTSDDDSTSQSSTMNEYHGNTPSFLTVKKCSKLPKVDCTTKALLLCYPPPGSSMAHDTLQMYLQNGGKYLIHIGEFKGLTGDGRFESLLVREMTCHSRRPCLTWGTDASHVTIWAKDGSMSSPAIESPKLLLPCSLCYCQEGKRRCRLLRGLVYCSKSCFEDDATVRAKKIGMQWIPLQSDALSFTNPQHFLVL